MAEMTLPTATTGSRDTFDFTELVGTHQAMVFTIAYHYLGDRAVAEEIAQDVFLQLYSQLSKVTSQEHAVFWLRRAAVHRCIDYSRRMRARQEVAIATLQDVAAASVEGDEWMNQRLRNLVASLPEESRMIVVLRYQEDLEPKEIAALLKMPVNTVKSRLQRSLALLREKIEVDRGV